MKKILSLALALVMVLGISSIALADVTVDLPVGGSLTVQVGQTVSEPIEISTDQNSIVSATLTLPTGLSFSGGTSATQTATGTLSGKVATGTVGGAFGIEFEDDDNKTNTLTITVAKGDQDIVVPAEVWMKVGGTYQLSPYSNDMSNARITAAQAYTYTSQAQATATVDAAGLITGVALGVVDITVNTVGDADYDAATATVTVHVVNYLPGSGGVGYIPGGLPVTSQQPTTTTPVQQPAPKNNASTTAKVKVMDGKKTYTTLAKEDGFTFTTIGGKNGKFLVVSLSGGSYGTVDMSKCEGTFSTISVMATVTSSTYTYDDMSTKSANRVEKLAKGDTVMIVGFYKGWVITEDGNYIPLSKVKLEVV